MEPEMKTEEIGERKFCILSSSNAAERDFRSNTAEPHCRTSSSGDVSDVKYVTGNAPVQHENICYKKPDLSYIAMISMAIQSLPTKQMLLSEIYDWITTHYPYYRPEDKSWRNSIRHNLSLNECFVKSGRSESGKGHYWSIHPANMDDFGRGDFRRRRARRRVRKCDEELRNLCEPYGVNGLTSGQEQSISTHPQVYSGFVPMSSAYVSTGYLTTMFGVEPILSRDESQMMTLYPNRYRAPNKVFQPNVHTLTGSGRQISSSVAMDKPAVHVNVNVNLEGFQPRFG